MSLFNKIKSVLGRRSSTQPAVSSQSGETPASEPPVILPTSKGRGEGSGLKNSIARGVAEGTAREMVREFFEEFLGD